MKFNYQKICGSFLKSLPQRTGEVIERRFGLKTGQRETLEAIGQSYGRTRERIRQVEEDGFSKIKPKIEKNQEVFKYFEKVLASFGGLKKEDKLLEFLGGNKFQNQVFFLMVLGYGFERILEDDKFYTCWALDKKSLNQAKKTVKLTITRLKKERQPLSLRGKVLFSYLEISKEIEKNPEGLYGLRDWLEINPRGVKDKAYLVFKREEKPLHFAEVASLIEKLPFPSQGKTHVATVHNELIKDDRFVLVGRGLYALKEWGYEPGVVKDIVYKTLKQSKRPLTKKEILEKVLEQRFVKENTVVLNLQDSNYFTRDTKGKYRIA